jgi:SAM-dependent methyltransferase
MKLIEKIRRHGIAGTVKLVLSKVNAKSGYSKWKVRHAPVYVNPTPADLVEIEKGLIALGIDLHDYAPPAAEFHAFQAQGWFPPDYHGGLNSGVWDEKLLEHWLSSERLGVMCFGPRDIYVDIAAATSPWAQALHERKNINAIAIDLCEIGMAYRHLDYYRVENATATTFANASVSGATLHCAYEMFMGQDDTKLINELARILKPGGKVVILPLYMHTHYCAYSTPDYFGKGYSDPIAKEYVRLDCSGVPSSRKYDPLKLKERVLDPVLAAGLRYKLSVLRNKNDFGKNIYCHFILEIEK